MIYKCAALIVTLWIACTTAIANSQDTITLSTYAREGKPIALAVTLQSQYSSQKERSPLNLLPTPGGVDNVRAIRDRKAQAAFANAAVAYEASWGFGAFVNSPIGVRTVAAMYPHNLHVVVHADSSIKTFADLRGKRVSIGAKGSGSEQIATRLFSAAKISLVNDVSVTNANLAESVRALVERRIDAFIFGSAAPVDAISTLASSTPVRFIDTANMVSELNRQHGRLYAEGTIPANTYVGQRQPVFSLDVWDLLVVSESVSVDTAYRLAKAVHEARERMGDSLPSAARVSAKQQGEVSPIALHLGAQLFLAELGVAPFNRLYRIKQSKENDELNSPARARSTVALGTRAP